MESFDAIRLRVYVLEGDKHGPAPAWRALVDRAHEQGIIGATVLRGALGYGQLGRMHNANILRLSEELPVIVEIIEREEQIDAFLPVVEEVIPEGLVTTEPVRAAFLRKDDA